MSGSIQADLNKMNAVRADHRAAVAALLKCLLLCTLLLSVQFANADTIIVQSGRRYDGDFVSEDANTVKSARRSPRLISVVHSANNQNPYSQLGSP